MGVEVVLVRNGETALDGGQPVLTERGRAQAAAVRPSVIDETVSVEASSHHNAWQTAPQHEEVVVLDSLRGFNTRDTKSCDGRTLPGETHAEFRTRVAGEIHRWCAGPEKRVVVFCGITFITEVLRQLLGCTESRVRFDLPCCSVTKVNISEEVYIVQCIGLSLD